MSSVKLGIGWGPKLAWFIDNRKDLEFIEVVVEDSWNWKVVPEPILKLTARGVKTILHGTTIGLGGAEPLCRKSLRKLAHCAQLLNCALVSEHIAFVRADGIESGHLLPVPRTNAMLDVLSENIAIAPPDETTRSSSARRSTVAH